MRKRNHRSLSATVAAIGALFLAVTLWSLSAPNTIESRHHLEHADHMNKVTIPV